MKVLAKARTAGEGYVLLMLTGNGIKRRIKGLVEKGRYRKAISEAEKNGKTVEVIEGARRFDIGADLIITEKSAHWDIP